jgi:hypothetical protein
MDRFFDNLANFVLFGGIWAGAWVMGWNFGEGRAAKEYESDFKRLRDNYGEELSRLMAKLPPEPVDLSTARINRRETEH